MKFNPKMIRSSLVLGIVGLCFICVSIVFRFLPINQTILDSKAQYESLSSNHINYMMKKGDTLVIVIGEISLHVDVVNLSTNEKTYDVDPETLYDEDTFSTLMGGLEDLGYQTYTPLIYLLINPIWMLGGLLIIVGIIRLYYDPKRQYSYDQFNRVIAEEKASRLDHQYKNRWGNPDDGKDRKI